MIPGLVRAELDTFKEKKRDYPCLLAALFGELYRDTTIILQRRGIKSFFQLYTDEASKDDRGQNDIQRQDKNGEHGEVSSNLARRFDDLRGLVDDLHVALRTLDTAGMFYPKPDDVRADDLPLVTLRELEAMATAIHEDLRMIELGIYRITSKIIESARTGAIKQTSELLDRETSTTGGGRGPCDVLIVDDDHEVGELLAAYLATKHVSTRVVSRSSDYLADIRTANPRLVLLDVALSGKSGYDVCAGIKQDERMRDIRVLLFTAMPLAQVIAQLPACHADGYLLKPFTLNDVDRAIGIAGSWES